MADPIRTVLVEQKLIYEERIAELTKERDEARREVCDLKTFNFDDTITAHCYADLRKWDCFKKKTLKDCFKENT
jgi:hypothetical protein